MFTVVRTATTLSLDEHFIKHPAATFFVNVEGVNGGVKLDQLGGVKPDHFL
jgi:hypothetical protein